MVASADGLCERVAREAVAVARARIGRGLALRVLSEDVAAALRRLGLSGAGPVQSEPQM